MQEELTKRLQNLQQKFVQLAEQNKKLISKNQLLENEIALLKNSIEENADKVLELNNQIKIIKLARSIDPETDTEKEEVTELKRKINEYIREIDSCIAMLND
jgi:acetolactate synthase small subunit